MSFDLVVFHADAAPKDEAGFLQWYRSQASGAPSPARPELRAWSRDMEDRGGPFDAHATYDMVYAAFARDMATEIFHLGFELAGHHAIGLYDPQSSTRWLPRDGGSLYQYSEDAVAGDATDAVAVAEAFLGAMVESGDLERDESGDWGDLTTQITRILDRARHRSALSELWRVFMSHDAIGELYLDKDDLLPVLQRASEDVRGHAPTSTTGWM